MASERFASSGQSGLPGHCYVAQVWDENGSSVAEITPNNDPAIATRLAELFADSLNVLHTTGKTPRELAGEVERLEREISRTAGKIAYDHPQLDELTPSAKLWAIDQCSEGMSAAIADLHEHIARLTKQRDELLSLVQELEYALTSPSRQFCDVTREEMSPWTREAKATLARVNQPAAVTANENAGEAGE